MIRVEDLLRDIRIMISETNAENSFFSDELIISSINNNAMMFGADVLQPQAILKTTLNTNTQEFGLPASVQNLLSLKLDKSVIEYIEYDDFLRSVSGADIQSGFPTHYYLREHYDDIIKDTVLAVGFNCKTDKPYAIEAQVVIYPNVVTDITDTLPFGRDCFLPLKYSVLAELYEKDGKFDKANYYFGKYKMEKERIKGKLFNRVPDYVNL